MSSRRSTATSNELKLSKTQMDSCLELIRSVALFFATTKMLALTAMFILAVTTEDSIYSILNISEEDSDLLRGFVDAFSVLIIVILLQAIAISMFAIYGFAFLSRHALSFYGFVLLLMMCWAVFYWIIIGLRDDTDLHKTNLYRHYNDSHNGKIAVSILQQTLGCCGSAHHKYPPSQYPGSCCPNSTSDNSTCAPKDSFKKLCQSNRTRVISSLHYNDRYVLASVSSLCGFCLIGFEAVLVFYMVYRLTVIYNELHVRR